ncbi:Citryl-CoA lyase [Desulfobulbus propionicus DSM 2032]|uniref:Citryl-CoA lyase n=1 Tax=Desulfobulbus propionicus (strain ATCC 33891 / DSM 2032 / VKM B-1956 / 1pr3) TaxID=577650 RepID=A0A7U3YN91_DESPD|nr:CoA ester lyase [Desulfobulbus propionicus]ADW18500.1 Citryl-CoA lyase [Desulfobulbus propionicus DSM 2032]
MKPRRSNLSVPGHMKKMHEKASQSAADVIMLDLEDSVPVDEKATARAQVIDSLRSLDWSHKTVTVRINSLDTPFAYRDLLEVAEHAGHVIDAIVIPKVNDGGDIFFADRLLTGIELSKDVHRPIGIEASIETAEGLRNASKIMRASKRVISLVFGIADYSASIGARLVSISGHGEKEEDLYPGHRWHFAISNMVMHAKAGGALAIDAPYGNFKDMEGLRRSAVMASALGCDGKWAIHPSQIDILNEVFTPSPEEIALAAKVMEANARAQSEGKGAIAVEGRMVDQATVRLATKLWEQAKFLNLV